MLTHICKAKGFTENNGSLIQALVLDEGYYWSKAGGRACMNPPSDRVFHSKLLDCLPSHGIHLQQNIVCFKVMFFH